MRKSIIAVFAFLLITGCSPRLQEWNTAYIPTGYDFTEYAEDGFLFTPEGYNGEYESMGVVHISFMPEIRLIQGNTKPQFRPGYDVFQVNNGYYYIQKHDTERIIKEMHTLATGMGADAVIRFEIVPELLDNEGIKITSIRAVGFAIKRVK